MTESLLLLVVFALNFAYGWFLRGRYTPRRLDNMNEHKRKFLLWWVRREIKKFNKKHLIYSRKQQITYLNAANPHSRAAMERWIQHKADVERLEQLMKWEYSLNTINKSFGEDITHRKEKPRFSSRMFSEPTPEQWDKYRAKVLAEQQALKKRMDKRDKKQSGRTSK